MRALLSPGSCVLVPQVELLEGSGWRWGDTHKNVEYCFSAEIHPLKFDGIGGGRNRGG